jgi:transcription elongation GreA/GreB family factor
MDKKKLLDHIIQQLETELLLITEAAKNTYEIATHEENKAENEYDTRGLEASYLAGAQAERVAEMKNSISLLKSVKLKSFSSEEPIGYSAIIEIQAEQKLKTVFVLPKAGGTQITFDEKLLSIVTPDSPLGEALIGLKVGDEFSIDAGKNQKYYEIISIL